MVKSSNEENDIKNYLDDLDIQEYEVVDLRLFLHVLRNRGEKNPTTNNPAEYWKYIVESGSIEREFRDVLPVDIIFDDDTTMPLRSLIDEKNDINIIEVVNFKRLYEHGGKVVKNLLNKIKECQCIKRDLRGLLPLKDFSHC